MSISPQPPPDLVGQIQWLIAQVINLQRRLNGISSSGGGGGSVTLTENQIAYGSASNEVTSSSGLIYSAADATFGVKFNDFSYFAIGDFFQAIGDLNNVTAGITLLINDTSNTLTVGDITGYGLLIDMQNYAYKIGDINDTNNSTKLVIDDTNKLVILGDVDGIDSGGYITVANQGVDGYNVELGGAIFGGRASLSLRGGPDNDCTLGDLGGLGNGTKLIVNDTTKTITHATGVGSIDIDLSNITAPRARTEPDKAGEYAVGWFAGVSDPLSGGTVTVTDANATTTSIINITPIDNGTPIVSSNFSVVRTSGSFNIIDTAAGANDGLTFMYMFTNP